jgi:hypothetical protein
MYSGLPENSEMILFVLRRLIRGASDGSVLEEFDSVLEQGATSAFELDEFVAK